MTAQAKHTTAKLSPCPSGIWHPDQPTQQCAQSENILRWERASERPVRSGPSSSANSVQGSAMLDCHTLPGSLPSLPRKSSANQAKLARTVPLVCPQRQNAQPQQTMPLLDLP